MKIKIFFLTFSLLLGCRALSLAQNAQLLGVQDSATLENDRIEALAINVEKPQTLTPTPDLAFNPQPLKYQSVELTFKPALVPLKLESRTLPPFKWEPLQNNYIKAGFGLFLTPFLRAHLANGRDKNWDYGADIQLLASAAGHTEQAGFVDNHIRVRGAYAMEQFTVYARAHFNYYWFNAFGDSLLLKENRPANWQDSLRRHFTRFQLELGIRSNDRSQKLSYDFGLRLASYSERFPLSEFHGSLLPQLSYAIDKNWSIRLHSELTVSSFKRYDIFPSTTSQAGMFTDLTPLFVFQKGKLRGQLGARFNYAKSDSVSQTGFYPVAKVQFQAIDKFLIIEGGISGQSIYNNRFSLAPLNPYISPLARLLPSRELFRVQGGVSGGVKGFSYLAEVTFRKIGNMLIFLSAEDTVYRNQKIKRGEFQLYYEEGLSETAFSFQLSYNHKDKIQSGVKTEFRVFALEQLPKNFQVPGFLAEAFCRFQALPKLYTYAGLNIIGPRTMSFDKIGNFIEQNVFIDMNLEIDYQILERFSIFVLVNNLFNSAYYRWHFYKERPLDLKAGITFSF
jgi:hypothetical protein